MSDTPTPRTVIELWKDSLGYKLSIGKAREGGTRIGGLKFCGSERLVESFTVTNSTAHTLLEESECVLGIPTRQSIERELAEAKAEIAELRKVYASLKDGFGNPSDFFDVAAPVVDVTLDGKQSGAKGGAEKLSQALAGKVVQ